MLLSRYTLNYSYLHDRSLKLDVQYNLGPNLEIKSPCEPNFENMACAIANTCTDVLVCAKYQYVHFPSVTVPPKNVMYI